MAFKYFLYSKEQIKEKNTILGKTNKVFEPGVISINGRKEKFTQLSSSPSIDRFVDTKIIASGEESNFTFTLPKAVPKRG